jgi:predicted dienelactone hydrolase
VRDLSGGELKFPSLRVLAPEQCLEAGSAQPTIAFLSAAGCLPMKIKQATLLSAVAAIATMLAGAGVHAAGFQQGDAADPGGKPLVIGIWYPSQAVAKPVSLGPTTMTVAINAPVNGKALPMIVMSHGTGSSYLQHFDTAIALADAGFVVVAMNHTGDNYADHSRSLDVMDRPRQVSRVIDHMLSTWEGRAAIDPQRVGMFGFSSGGFTTLALIGGVPDFTKIGPMCRQYPGDFACQLMARSESPVAAPANIAVTDARIKAAVVAAPALGFTFSPDGLKNVRVPVQLWRAEHDTLVPHPRYAEAVRLALPEAPDYRVVANAGHYDFLASCSDALASLAPAICTSPAGFDRTTFHVGFNSEVVKFFGKTLEIH